MQARGRQAGQPVGPMLVQVEASHLAPQARAEKTAIRSRFEFEKSVKTIVGGVLSGFFFYNNLSDY